MKASLSRILLFLGILIIVGFVLFMVNQTILITEFFDRIRPGLGAPVLYLLLTLYAVCLVVPLMMFLRFPKPLRAPSSKSDPEYLHHLELLRRRLRGNPNVNKPFSKQALEDEIEETLVLLGTTADTVIKKEASAVFMITAVSQSGRLDAISVLAAQTRMVWRIAHLYYQRPTFRDMIYLYSNIAVSVFMATEIEDLEIDEQLEPIIGGLVAGSAAGAIPGASVIASLIVSSVLTGAANALFTLRVGVLTKRYCASLTFQDRRTVKRAATIEAVGMLGGIVLDSGTNLSKRVFGATKRQVGKKVLTPLSNHVDAVLKKTRLRRSEGG